MPDLTGASTRPSALGFAQVYHVVTGDASLSDGAFRTYAALLKFARMGKTWVSRDQLASFRGKTTASISAHLSELQEAGYITRHERGELTAITVIVPIDKVSRKLDTTQESKKLDTEEEHIEVSDNGLQSVRTLGEGTGRVSGPPESEAPSGSGERGWVDGLTDYPDGGKAPGPIASPVTMRRNRKASVRIQEPDEPLDADEDSGGRPKWAVPDSPEQEAFLAAVRAKSFEPRQKAQVKGIVARIRAGSLLNGGVYAECERQIGDITDLHIRLPNVLPVSWWDRNIELAKQYKWSRSNLLNGMLNRERLAEHLRYMMKKSNGRSDLTPIQNSGTIDADDYLSSLTR
jgi:hypothetical protein